MTGRSSSRNYLIACAVLPLLLLAGCGGASGDPVTTLKVGSQKGGTKALMLASGALDGAPYTVEWSEFPAAQPLLEAVGSGAVDVGLAGDAPFQFAYQSGSPVRAISAQTSNPRPAEALALIVPEKSSVRSVRDLVGKTVATTRGSIGHYLLLSALERARLSPDAVKLTFMSPADTKAAFSTGAIDGWAAWVPYLTAALKDHARIIFDGRLVSKGYSFEVANKDAIATKSAQLADFAKREVKALLWQKSHLDDYARVLAADTGLPLDIARTLVVKNQRVPVPINDALIADQQQILDTFVRSGDIKAPHALGGGFQKAG